MTRLSLALESSEGAPLEAQLIAGMLLFRNTNHPLFKLLGINP